MHKNLEQSKAIRVVVSWILSRCLEQAGVCYNSKRLDCVSSTNRFEITLCYKAVVCKTLLSL